MEDSSKTGHSEARQSEFVGKISQEILRIVENKTAFEQKSHSFKAVEQSSYAVLRKSRSLFSSVFNNLKDSILLSLPRGEIILANSSALASLGLSEEEMSMAKRASVIVQNEEAEAFEGQQGSGKWNGILIFRRKDGSTFPAEVSSNMLEAPDGHFMTLIVFQDITDRRKMEEELAMFSEWLEILLRERTTELEDKAHIIGELRSVTRLLMKYRQEDRKELENRFLSNLKKLILPYIEKMKNTRLDERQISYMCIMETHLDEIMSPLIKNLQMYNLTPTESQISSLIKDGKATKEIAALMGVATSSNDTHRKNIRKKLGVNNSRVNLQSYLQTIDI